MSRHGYSDDADNEGGALAMWRGRVASSIRGKRGQVMLRELRDALDSMPEKRLVSRLLQTKDGECCTLGRLAQVKGLDLTEHEHDDEYELAELNETLAVTFNVAECLVQEIEYENDECGRCVPGGSGNRWREETPEERWERMRRWVAKRIKEPTDGE